jgi:hypothetical protein
VGTLWKAVYLVQECFPKMKVEKMPTFAETVCVYACTCPSCVRFQHPREFSSLAHPSLKDEYWLCSIGCDLNTIIYCVDFFEKYAYYFKQLSKNIIDIQTFSLWLYLLIVDL